MVKEDEKGRTPDEELASVGEEMANGDEKEGDLCRERVNPGPDIEAPMTYLSEAETPSVVA